MTKVRLQPDCELKLVHDSSSLRLRRCAEFIFPFPFSVAALCLPNFSALVSPFDLLFTCATGLKRLSHHHNLFELPPADFLVLGTFSAIDSTSQKALSLCSLSPRPLSLTIAWYPLTLSIKPSLSFSMTSTDSFSPSQLAHSSFLYSLHSADGPYVSVAVVTRVRNTVVLPGSRAEQLALTAQNSPSSSP